MKVRFNRWYNAVLSVLLAMMGYGCSEEDQMDEYGPPIDMYGTPPFTYSIHGAVMDEDSIPVQGIKATLQNIRPDSTTQIVTHDSTLTDSVGEYRLGVLSYHMSVDTKLVVEDIDGEANGGEFQSDTIDIAKMMLEGKGFDSGNLQVDITLKKKAE